MKLKTKTKVLLQILGISCLWTVTNSSCATTPSKSPVSFAQVKYLHIFADPENAKDAKTIENVIWLGENNNSAKPDQKANTRNYFEAKSSNPVFRYLIKSDMDKKSLKAN